MDDIDIFTYPDEGMLDEKWRPQKAKLLNIMFQPGTFGHFLRFVLEKFSKKTPELLGDPFTDIGTSHSVPADAYSGSFEIYHTGFIKRNSGAADLPLCIITASSPKHFLFIKMAYWFRVSDRKIKTDQLWKRPVGEMADFSIKEIINLYNLPNDFYSWIPKFIVRDWFKLNFLNPIEQDVDHRWYKKLLDHEFVKRQNIFRFDIESFFDRNIFINNLQELDRKFNLDLDFSRQAEMLEMFDKGFRLDELRIQCQKAEHTVNKQGFSKLGDLDVAAEAFIYAEIEKRYPGVQMPLSNQFFRDSDEVWQFIENYPNWYRRPNPNLPRK